jgi:hypothetical protein
MGRFSEAAHRGRTYYHSSCVLPPPSRQARESPDPIDKNNKLSQQRYAHIATLILTPRSALGGSYGSPTPSAPTATTASSPYPTREAAGLAQTTSPSTSASLRAPI